MESAVESILIREGQLQEPTPRNDIIPRRDNYQIERPRHYGSNLSVPIDYSNARRPSTTTVNSQQLYYNDPTKRDPKKYRGTLCQLPNDFLRPPSIYRAQHINDEELALMLQNELFQREAFAALGSDMRGIQPSGQYRNRENMSYGGNRQQNQQSTQSEGIPDLGILKGLSTMSAAAKAKLSELAERFQNSSSSSGSSSLFNRNKVNISNERDRETEMRRLMDNDEDDEVIDFGSSNDSRGQHSLNETRNTYRKKDD